MDGQNTILSVVGPLATTVGGLKLITEALLSTRPWKSDLMVVELPWREEQEKLEKKLSFGVIYHDGVVGFSPPVKRALKMTAAALQEARHEIVEWKAPFHSEMNDIAMKTWVYDGGLDISKSLKLSSEPMAEQLSGIYGSAPFEQFTGDMIAANNVAQRELKKNIWIIGPG